MTKDILLRGVTQEDWAYLYATWLKHYKFSSDFAKRIPHSIFFHKHHLLIGSILRKKETVTLIAYPKDSPEIIVGYITYEKPSTRPVIHFIYVKRAFRKMGVARELIEVLDLSRGVFTHWTEDTDWIVRKVPSLQYDPYSI